MSPHHVAVVYKLQLTRVAEGVCLERTDSRARLSLVSGNKDAGGIGKECVLRVSALTNHHLLGKCEPSVSCVYEENLGVLLRDPENASVSSAERREKFEAEGEFRKPLVRRVAAEVPRAA